MLPDLQIVRDVSGGTRHLRFCERAQLYLPPEPKEKPEAYAIRRSRATLFNAYERAVNGLVGLVFREEPTLSDDVPELMRGREEASEAGEIEGQLEDCDLAGTHWAVFAKELFAAAFEGHAFLYVDMPPALPEGATLEDERRAGRRPYFVLYRKDQAVNWRLDARGRLAQITFEEKTLEPDGEFGEQEVCRYRVLRPGSWQLFRKVQGRDGNWQIIPDPDAPEGKTSLSEIPVAICYTKKIKPLQSRPALLDLAMLNLTHYAETSDYRTYLHIASRPLLWFKNRDKSKKVENIGPYTLFDVGTDGLVAFAETSGAALGAARQDLKDLEEHMAVLGLSMLKQKTAQKTATEERGDQIRELSELATAARSLQDCFEQAFRFWAMYLGQPSGGSIKLGVSDEDLVLSDAQMRVYNEMAGHVLSRKTVREILKERHALPETWSEDEEQQRLQAEATQELAQQRTIGEVAMQAFDRGLPAGLEPAPTAPTAEEVTKLATAAGVLIRAGFEPQAALVAVGLDPIKHTGLVPVTVQSPDAQ